jgi:hypothetical protein
MRLSLALFALLLSISGNVLAEGQQIAPEKRAEIEKLLEFTGAMKLTQQFSSAMVTRVTDALRSTHPDIPQKALDILPEVVDGVISENAGSLKETIIHIYDENFTLQEVKGLNQFYSSPVGRKAAKVLPSVLAESFAAGQKWGQALAPEMTRRIEARFQKEGISL